MNLLEMRAWAGVAAWESSSDRCSQQREVNKKLHHCRHMKETSEPTSQHQQAQQDVEESVKATNSKTINFIGLQLEKWGRGRNHTKGASD